MKILILVRHAQAVDQSPVITDHDRPLTSKGIKQSKKLPKLLRKLDIKPDHVISSTANRCHDTAKQICKKFDLKLHTDENLFFKGIDPYLNDITSATDNIQSLAIV
jgi:phosphohistidine phosphatase